MWKDSIRNIVVTFQTTILRIVGFYVRHSATDQTKDMQYKAIVLEAESLFFTVPESVNWGNPMTYIILD